MPFPFDLDATLNSGQVFHWHRHADGWTGAIENQAVHVRVTPDGLSVTPPEMSKTVRHYFALDHDFDGIIASFPKHDAPLETAIQFSPGLRIMRQPIWECLATFITSSLKQVPHIRQISLTLREKFGEPLPSLFPGSPPLFAYPTPLALAEAGEEALRACGLGYRAKFLHRTASDLVAGKLDLASLASQTDDEARASLMQFHGVGEKIANCVLLFACERLGIVPIDVWIERVLRELYFAKKRKVTPERIRKFAATHFGPHAGYAQQFLFHHARLTKLK